MKKIGLPILGNILVFLLFAFSQWDINPNNWGEETRVICAFIMAVVLSFSLIYAVIENNK